MLTTQMVAKTLLQYLRLKPSFRNILPSTTRFFGTHRNWRLVTGTAHNNAIGTFQNLIHFVVDLAKTKEWWLWLSPMTHFTETLPQDMRNSFTFREENKNCITEQVENQDFHCAESWFRNWTSQQTDVINTIHTESCKMLGATICSILSNTNTPVKQVISTSIPRATSKLNVHVHTPPFKAGVDMEGNMKAEESKKLKVRAMRKREEIGTWRNWTNISGTSIHAPLRIFRMHQPRNARNHVIFPCVESMIEASTFRNIGRTNAQMAQAKSNTKNRGNEVKTARTFISEPSRKKKETKKKRKTKKRRKQDKEREK